VLRHLSGRGTKSVLISQQNKIAFKYHRRKLKDNCTQPIEDSPIPSLLSDSSLESSIPIHNDLLQHMPEDGAPNSPMGAIDDDPGSERFMPSSIDIQSFNQSNSQLYQDCGVWHFPGHANPSFARPLEEESNSECSTDDEGSAKELEPSDKESPDEDLENWGDETQSWLQGMSAVEELEEEFECRAMQSGS
jgi:hypothetical protein